MKLRLARGFTLVELLIVIGLLGAIALIVIAAINPIEQANRARDARYQADGGQLLSAVERFFATHSQFPWSCDANGNLAGCLALTDSQLNFVTARNALIGLCADANCTTNGTLIASDELKTEFLSRDWVKPVTGSPLQKEIQIGKYTGSSSSVYACFIPLAKATRDRAITDAKVHSLGFAANGTVTTTTTCDAANDPDWATGSCYVCIPE